MALTIAIEGKGVIANADAISDSAGGTWSEQGGGTMSVSNDVFLINGVSMGGKYASKSGFHQYDIGSGNELDFTASTGSEAGQYIYFLVSMTALGTLDTVANYGLALRISSSSPGTSNYCDYLIAGNDDLNGWNGRWKVFVLDPTKTPTRVSGTQSSIIASVRTLGIWIDCSTSARADSIFTDMISVGSGLRVTGTSTTGWKEVVDYCTDYTTRGWPVFEQREGIYYCYGMTNIGDAASQTAAVSFTDSGRVIQFGESEYWTGSVWASTMPTGVSGVNIEDHTSYTTTFSDGILVGTDNGRSGTSFIGQADIDVSLDLYGGNNAGSLTTLYGTQIKNCTGSINSGNDADHKFYAVSVSGSGQFDPVGAPVIRNCIFSETDSTAGSLLWNENIDVEDCNFIANTTGAAVEHPSAAGTPYTHTNLIYSGNTFDVNNTSGSAISVSKTGTSNPSTYTGSLVTYIGASVTVQATATLKDGTPVENALVYLKASNGTGPFPFEDTVTITRSTTTATVAHTAHGMQTNDKIVLEGITDKTEDNYVIKQITVTGVNAYTYTTTDSGSTSYTGTILCTFVLLSGLTNASGISSVSRVYPSNQPHTGWARKSTSSPFLQEGVLIGTVDSVLGYSGTAIMLADE